MIEQRRSKRFDLKLPVELVRPGTAITHATCETRNMSSSGVLIMTQIPLAVGESIEYLITLPVNGAGEQSVRLRCMGKIVRHESAGSAATLERYEFLR